MLTAHTSLLFFLRSSRMVRAVRPGRRHGRHPRQLYGRRPDRDRQEAEPRLRPTSTDEAVIPRERDEYARSLAHPPHYPILVNILITISPSPYLTFLPPCHPTHPISPPITRPASSHLTSPPSSSSHTSACARFYALLRHGSAVEHRANDTLPPSLTHSHHDTSSLLFLEPH